MRAQIFCSFGRRKRERKQFFFLCLLLIVQVALREAERFADRASHVSAQVTAPAPHGRVSRGGRDLTLVLLGVEGLARGVNGVDERSLPCKKITTTTLDGRKKMTHHLHRKPANCCMASSSYNDQAIGIVTKGVPSGPS